MYKKEVASSFLGSGHEKLKRFFRGYVFVACARVCDLERHARSVSVLVQTSYINMGGFVCSALHCHLLFHRLFSLLENLTTLCHLTILITLVHKYCSKYVIF